MKSCPDGRPDCPCLQIDPTDLRRLQADRLRLLQQWLDLTARLGPMPTWPPDAPPA